ncbi:cell wall hydrolase [Croceibacterium aestuarii]|uniref:cell wall hydrolase n=1 Tax=Croceibacterium aestuarii TaxID=3064139 RepID=UPI00272E29B4|nr:cell wall hydrolase [Croceibacterium sp. D39]
MSRKTHKAAALAVAASLIFTLANTGGSGAFAQESKVAVEDNVPTVTETQDPAGPHFVANEVVQPLPQDAAPSAAIAEGSEPLSLRELVADMPVEGELPREMRCLAEAIYFEARGEPLAGQLAVGRVIINRAESAAFPDDYCGVVTQRAQFSFVKHGVIPAPRTGTTAWKKAVAVAKIAHQELWDSPAGDSLYFHATRIKPRWASRKIARATLARHVFYR